MCIPGWQGCIINLNSHFNSKGIKDASLLTGKVNKGLSLTVLMPNLCWWPKLLPTPILKKKKKKKKKKMAISIPQHP